MPLESSLCALLLVTVLSGGFSKPIENQNKECLDLPEYNKTYPFTKPIISKNFVSWRIAIISDRDRASKYNTSVNIWQSRFKRGTLSIRRRSWKKAKVQWDPEDTDSLLNYDLSQKGRGMELSELIVYNGKLYTCDDRTGVVYELTENGRNVLPFVHLNDGDGRKNKGYKCEWMTVKDEKLWIGSTGKEWSTPKGVFMNHDPEWIKVVDMRGVVQHLNWTDNYLALRTKTGYGPPGYFFHESAAWSTTLNQWIFLPRKVSHEIYDDDEDEKRCGNLLLRTDENFTTVFKREIGPLNVTRGFSSFKFVPRTMDRLFVALKTVEVGSAVESYIGVYSVNGRVLLPETFISKEKFEGIEFI